MAVVSLNAFVDWWHVYANDGSPFRVMYDVPTSTATLFSVRSRQVVAKTVCSERELREAGVRW